VWGLPFHEFDEEELPEWVMQMFDAAPKHPLGKRKRETEIIHAAFTKGPNGWKVDFDKPFFQNEQVKFKKNYSNDSEVAKPRAIWAAEFAGGKGR